MTGPDVVLVSHEATRTGAPMNLLHLTRWVAEHRDSTVAVLAMDGGPLVERFEQVAPTVVLGSVAQARLPRLLDALRLRWAASKARGVMVRWRARPLRNPRLVYLNSLTSLRALHLLGRPQHVVTHVHEMEMAIRLSLRPGEWDELVRRTDLFIAASHAVADVLRARGVPDKVVRVHHEFIATDVVPASPPERAADRKALGIPEDAAVVGGAGVLEWRKGPDLFVGLAAELARRRTPAPHLVWVGGRHEGPMWERVAHDIEAAGLTATVHLLADLPDPARWFSQFDVFALTSREDPYPLVCLEVALLEVPTVCFGTAGTAELVRDGEAGRAVAHLDLDAMAAAVLDLLDHADERARAGRAAAQLVREHHDVAVAAPVLWADVEAVGR